MRFRPGAVVTAVLVPLAVSVWWAPAAAVPSFAREFKMSCTECHTVWPQLNEFGRDIKKGGYDAETPLVIDDDLQLNHEIPISARFNFRVIDKRTSRRRVGALGVEDKTTKMRSLHEVEVFFAGRAGETVSYFAEFEAEDEWPDPNGDAPGFQVQVATGAAGIHLSEQATVHAGFGTPFFADPYNTVNHHKIIRKDWEATDRGFLPGSESQFLSLTLMPNEKVTFTGAWHGNSGQLEGKDPKDISVRAAVDVSPIVSLGGYASFMQTYDSGTGESGDPKTRLFGGDFQLALDDLNIHGVVGFKDEDADPDDPGDSDEMNSVVSVEALFTTDAIAGQTIHPVVQFNRYTESDGDDSFITGAAAVVCEIAKNIRGTVGWEGDLSIPDRFDHKESRFTVLLDLGM